MSNKQIRMIQNGRVTPVKSFADLIESGALYKAVVNHKTNTLAVIEYEEFKHRDETATKVTPLITFTRYGEQEFANGNKPWWESAR